MDKLSEAVGYSGTFTIDAATLNLVTVELHADDLPAQLGFCQVADKLDFANVRLNQVEFLLPAQAETKVVKQDGIEGTNRTVFSGCREFRGESKLIFDASQESRADSPQSHPQPIQLPPGTDFVIALSENIDPENARRQRPRDGALLKPIDMPERHMKLPVGTVFHGRVWRLLSTFDNSRKTVELALRWESMDFGEMAQPLRLKLTAVVPKTAKSGDAIVRFPPLILGETVDDSIGYLSFALVERNYRIPAGFATHWIPLEDQSSQAPR